MNKNFRNLEELKFLRLHDAEENSRKRDAGFIYENNMYGFTIPRIK